MATFASRYRKFSPTRVEPLGDGRHALHGGPLGGEPLIVDEFSLSLAQCFNGERDADAVREHARQTLDLELGREALESFATELAVADVLEAGAVEPLPAPSYTDSVCANTTTGALLPSTVPGSLAGPGLMDGLLGVVTDGTGRPRPMLMELAAGPWIAFGRLFNWPLRSRAALCLFALLLLAGCYGVARHYLEAAEDLLRLLQPVRMVMMTVLGLVAIQIFSACGRAAAAASFTEVTPRMGFLEGWFGIPLLYVDTSGAAERAPRRDRMRIVGAGLTSLAALGIVSIQVWFLARLTHANLASFSLGTAVFAFVTMILRANPLARRDGYFLLAQHFGIPDLREQTMYSVFRYFRKGWVGQQRALQPATLVWYWVLIVLYLLLLIYLLSLTAAVVLDWFRGPGFVVLLVVMGVIVSQTFRNSREGVNLDLGQVSRKPWYLRWAAVLVAIAVISIIPYRYDPSGSLVVLPGDRADVRALIGGDVRDVLVKEGDIVKAGQVLAKIADDEERAQVAIAKAKLAQTQADLALAKKGGKAEEVQVAESAVETARQRAQVSAQQAQRIATAYKHNSVTAQEYERARGLANVDQKSLDEAQSKLALVRSGADAERIAALEAQVHEATAALEYSEQQLQYTEIKAPIAGRVVSGSLMFAKGSYLNRGDQLAVVEDAQQRLAEIKLPETSVDQVTLGKASWAKVWAFPAASFDGKVRSIAPSAENGPYGKVVRVQVVLADPQQQLVPGMTGNAKVAGHWYPAIVVFTRAILRFALVEVWSWIP